MSSLRTATGRWRVPWPSSCSCCWWCPSCCSSAPAPASWPVIDEDLGRICTHHAGRRADIPLRADPVDDAVLAEQFAPGDGVGCGALADPEVVWRTAGE